MTKGAPPRWRLLVHVTLGSTQDEAIEAAHADDPGCLAILANNQTAGRGSRGRQWTGAAGNLHFSALFRPAAVSPPDPGRWALMAGIALHDAVISHLSAPQPLTLKWPNDLLLDGAKLGGILINSSLKANGALDWVVIGFGLNLASAPQLEGRRTAALEGLCPPRHVSDWATDILTGLDRWANESPVAVRDAWLARAHPIGTWLEIQTGAQTRAGAFDGLAPDGSLLLAAQPVPVSTGEVFLT